MYRHINAIQWDLSILDILGGRGLKESKLKELSSFHGCPFIGSTRNKCSLPLLEAWLHLSPSSPAAGETHRVSGSGTGNELISI